MADEMLFASAAAMAAGIRAGSWSALELVTTHLHRIAQVNPTLNAVVQLAEERALEEAGAADAATAAAAGAGEVDRLPPLHGVPVTIKDSLDTAGIVTTGGTTGRRAAVPEHDATVVRRLRRAGAIVLGKTNTPELTLAYETDNEVYGRTCNPYDQARTSGGSSGGAAAIIAAGGAPLDIGSDTGGSIRVPAHCCGITGLRPTSGRVSRSGHIVPHGLGMLDGLTTLGPLARTVEDLALCLPVMSGVDWRDPAVVPMPLGNRSDVALDRLQVAWFGDNGIVSPTAETAQAVATAVAAAAAGDVTCTETRPPDIERSMQVYTRLWSAYAPAWRRRLLQQAGMSTDAEPAEPATPATPAAEHAAIGAELDHFRSQLLAFFRDYDALICPVCAFPAWPHGIWREQIEAFSYSAAFNLTGSPVVVVRAGTSPEGLPIGVQIVGRQWEEHVVLALGAHIEQAVGPWPHPPL